MADRRIREALFASALVTGVRESKRTRTRSVYLGNFLRGRFTHHFYKSPPPLEGEFVQFFGEKFVGECSN